MIMAGGVAFPVVVLTALLAWGLAIARDIRVSAQEPAVRIEVSGEQWWWRITYLDARSVRSLPQATRFTFLRAAKRRFRWSAPT